MNNLTTFIHPNTFKGLANLQNIYIYGNQIPCNCSFLSIITNNEVDDVHLVADCFLQKQPSKIMSRTENLGSLWSNWSEPTTCSTTTYIRVRLCPDCSKKRQNSRLNFSIAKGKSVHETLAPLRGR